MQPTTVSTEAVPSTLLEVLRRHAHSAVFASRPAFTYLQDGDTVSTVLGYADLDAQARRLAARLQTRTRPGDRVLLVYPPSIDYIVAFYACVYAGVIAVPAVSPSNARTLPRLHAIVDDARPALALTQHELIRAIEKMSQGESGVARFADLPWLATDVPCDDEPVSAWRAPMLTGDDIVFLQYTSGSTGTPKGVMVSHARLLANAEHNRRTYRVPEGSTFVSWLPPHHDFGLIGAIVLPVFAGCHCVQFPPASFLMRPFRWLRLISQYRAYITGAPNFAFELCVQRVTEAQKCELDLSHLGVAVNGAERVRPETLRRFVEAFQPCGLRNGVVVPSYGMAESVLLVTAAESGADGSTISTHQLDRASLEAGLAIAAEPQAPDAVEVVLTGRALTGDHRVAIVDPSTCESLAERRVGEIWVSGPSVAAGYWGRDDNDGVFRASMAGQGGAWLRSGDLGFLDRGGLYVTGRLKEVMIFSGRNVYPQDVEMTVEALDPAFRANGCAAFAVEDDATARLAVVQEIEARRQPNVDGLMARLRAELAERHEIAELDAVVLVRAGHVPRTSSGKIQRGRCRQMYLDGALVPVWQWRREHVAAVNMPGEPRTGTERRLLALWEESLGRSGIGMQDNFFSLGGHSLLAAQIASRVGETFGIELPLVKLFEAPTIAGMAQFIDGARHVPGTAARNAEAQRVQPSADTDSAAVVHPLSHAQQTFWLLEQYAPGSPFHAIPLALTLAPTLDPEHLQRALQALVARQPSLRTTYGCREGIPVQLVHERSDLPLDVREWAMSAHADHERYMADELAREAARPFDLSTLWPVRATLLRRQVGESVLLLTLHHIAADGASVSLIVDELRRLCAPGSDRADVLPPYATTYLDYAAREARELAGERLASRLAAWRQSLAGAPMRLELPGARVAAASSNRARTGAAVVLQLPAARVASLDELARRHGVTRFTVLVTAMSALVHRLGGGSDFCLSMLSSNRPVGTERVIGNFINVVPLRQRIDERKGFGDMLQPNGRAILSAYQEQLPYQLLVRELLVDDARAVVAPYAQLVLNYHSELGAVDAGAAGPVLHVRGRAPECVTHVGFDLKVEVCMHASPLGEFAHFEFEYDSELYERATIERLAGHYRRVLELVAEQPDCPIGELPLLSQAER
ncbi:MAG: AMP-binding protein, partial [Burkholderiales bacterium]|nr:AMP-binding protein [Burkholderiales bacterium]